MTMSGTTWTRTLALPSSGAALTPEGVAEELMPWLADNSTGQISAKDMRNSFDLVISLFGASGVGPFDPTKTYKPNDLVSVMVGTPPNQVVQIFGAIGTIPPSNAGPGTTGANPNWKPIVAPTVVGTTSTSGESPTAPGATPLPPAISGNIFINNADNAVWVHDGAVWQRIPSGLPTVTVSNSPGVVPVNPSATQSLHSFPASYVPAAGDLFINTNDEDHYVYDGTAWHLLTSPPVQIAISRTAGDNPALQPPSWTPRIGDLYINDTDDAVWVWAMGGGASQYPNADWQPMTSAAGSAFVTDIPGDVPPSLVGPGQQGYHFPTTHTLAEGDRLVNRADHISWIYARNPLAAQPGQLPLIWVEIPTQNTAVLSLIPGEVPENPAAGQTAHGFSVPPRIGDIFVNRTDAKTWARVADPTGGPDFWELLPAPTVTAFTAGAGASVPAPDDDPNTHVFIDPPHPGDVYVVHNADGRSQTWIAIPGFGSYQPVFWQNTASLPPQFTLSQTSGETPTAPGTATLPAQTDPGDVFVNHADGFSWLAVPDAAGTGIEWQLIGSPPEQITVSQTAGETPTQPGTTTMPATSRPGDVFVNVPDRGTWTAFDNAGTLDWQRTSVEGPQFTISQTAGETPTAPGTTTMPTTTEYGDIFVNHADTTAWVAVPDAAGTGVEWQLVGHPQPQVFTTNTSGETPQNPGGVTLPTTVVEGSIFNNVTDQKMWVYADDPTNPGTLAWQPNPERRGEPRHAPDRRPGRRRLPCLRFRLAPRLLRSATWPTTPWTRTCGSGR